MNAELSVVWTKIQAMINSFFVLLPNIVLAIAVFFVFVFAGRSLKLAVKRLTRRHRQARNLGMVLGRLTQRVVVLIGLFVALSILIPILVNRWRHHWAGRRAMARLYI
jgi:hypothetical protein